jgi:PilZ domain
MECRDLLRIDSQTYARVIAQIASQAAGHRAKSKRKSERHTHLVDSPLVALFNYADESSRKAYQVRTVDLSEAGLGFLHGRLEHRDTPVLVLMHDLEGGLHKLTGRVAHTRLIAGRVHLVGVALDHRVETGAFVRDISQTEKTQINSDQQGWTDLVKLPAAEADRLIRAVEYRDENSKTRGKRKIDRNEFREGALMLIVHPDEPLRRGCFRVIPMNLSTSGIGFLHGAFLYPGTTCDIMLTTLEGKSELIRGQIARCELSKGRIHQVGVRFEVPIEVEHFIMPESDESGCQNPAEAA